MSASKRRAGREQRVAEIEGPAAIGFVLRYDEPHGCYRRTKVRIPLDLLDEVRAGEDSPPDHRSTLVAGISRDLMADEVLHQLHRKEGP